MTKSQDWRTGGVVIIRGGALAEARHQSGIGRATAFDFTGDGGRKTWIGSVTLPPGATTGAHHHGRHEVAIYVMSGQSEIRWGERLEFAADIGPGDLAYFAPHVPHQERNPDAHAPVEFLVVRSDNERIAVALDVTQVVTPEIVY